MIALQVRHIESARSLHYKTKKYIYKNLHINIINHQDPFRSKIGSFNNDVDFNNIIKYNF